MREAHGFMVSWFLLGAATQSSMDFHGAQSHGTVNACMPDARFLASTERSADDSDVASIIA